MKIPELLSPVGSKEALKAAVQNGADAVYLGGKMFSARQYASNFERDELREAFEYAHVRGVKVYVTANTLLHDKEFFEAVDYLKFLYEAGADGIIIQDIGVLRVVEKIIPDLPLHASTQMTIHNSPGVETLKKHNFTRIVLAREVSLQEIAEIKKKTGVEIEVFVHGALCVSYSGQCLMSSMIGGRSGNRGRCAQPCRMEYSLVDKNGRALVNSAEVGSHLLSPMDLNMVKNIPELVEAGVDSLKIEGRMKRPEYVATVTRIYREALDRFKSAPESYSVDDKSLKNLTQIFNRGFTTGYFFGKQGRDMMSYKRPNNRGLRLGRVANTNRAERMVEIVLEDTLRKGDGIEFWVTEGGRRGIVVNRIIMNGRPVEQAPAGAKVWIDAEGKIRPGDRIFKTHDVELISHAEASFTSPKEIKKIPLYFKINARIGSTFTISVTDSEDNSFTAVSEFLGQEALNKPLTADSLRQQTDRLGNTPYSIGRLEAFIDEGVMIPVSVINETRRKALDGLSEVRAKVKRPLIGEQKFNELVTQVMRLNGNESFKDKQSPENMKLSIRVNSLELVKSAAEAGADIIYFGGTNLLMGEKVVKDELQEALDICSSQGVQLVIATPRIIRENELKFVSPLLQFASKNDLAFLGANLGTLQQAFDCEITKVYSDFSLNVFNSHALKWLVDNFQLSQATISPELTFEQIAKISNVSEIPLEAVVEGHLPLMVTEYCPEGALLGDMKTGTKCKRPCSRDFGAGLQDRLGLVFPISRDEFCRNYIHNAKELSMIGDLNSLYKAGISVLRVEASIEVPEKLRTLVRIWRQELDDFIRNFKGYEPNPGAKAKIEELSPAGLTKGHYYRGVE